MAWSASFDPKALRELEKLDRRSQQRIVNFLRDRILSRADPRSTGKALTGDRGGLWRYRAGDYRLVCKLDDDAQNIRVLRVAHRKDVYR